MERFAFRMRLNPGCAREYRKRHDDIWPELVTVLKDAGISDYSIFLDPETHHLFAILTRAENHRMDELPEQEIMQRWWAYMADLMETRMNNEPVVVPLDQVFYMP